MALCQRKYDPMTPPKLSSGLVDGWEILQVRSKLPKLGSPSCWIFGASQIHSGNGRHLTSNVADFGAHVDVLKLYVDICAIYIVDIFGRINKWCCIVVWSCCWYNKQKEIQFICMVGGLIPRKITHIGRYHSLVVTYLPVASYDQWLATGL